MNEVTRKYKVLKCSNCSEFVYFKLGHHEGSCYLCGFKVLLPQLEGTYVSSLQEAQLLVQEHQNTSQISGQRGTNLWAAEQILKIIRSNQIDTLKWLSIHDISHQCLEAGFFPFEIRTALDLLTAEGFVEKQGDTIRLVPLI